MFKVGHKQPRYKWFSLYDKVFLEKHLKEAFFQVKRNGGAGGVDRVTLAQYARNLERNTKELSRLLREKRYRPLPVRRVYIPKPNGKKRPLGIPAIRDRVVQQSLANIIQPIFEPTFHKASFGFRPSRSPHQAIQQVEQHLSQGYQWVVDADIEDFFGNLDHELLLCDLNTKIADGSILALIRAFLEAGAMEEGKTVYQTTGTPQGGVISPILSNVYLDSFDWQMTEKGYRLVRYCDDWIVLTKTKEEAKQALALSRKLLSKKKLTLSREKTDIIHHAEGFEFLGFWFKDYDGVHRKGPRKKAAQAYKEKIRYATRRKQPRNIKMLVERINPITRGWGLYFRIGDVQFRFKVLDQWTRMRLRSFITKKRSITLKAHLEYRNEYFRNLGFVFLEDLRTRSFPVTGQRYR